MEQWNKAESSEMDFNMWDSHYNSNACQGKKEGILGNILPTSLPQQKHLITEDFKKEQTLKNSNAFSIRKAWINICFCCDTFFLNRYKTQMPLRKRVDICI